MLHKIEPKEKSQLSEFETAFVQKSLDQIKKGKHLTNDEIFEKTKKWLSE